jgi:phytoene dehydrogenase-like protein
MNSNFFIQLKMNLNSEIISTNGNHIYEDSLLPFSQITLNKVIFMTEYDAIIIGSGIGGTAVGALLASENLKTILIEKNEIVGGRCSTYERKGFKIDFGVHTFARSDKGPLGKVLEKVDMKNAINWSIVNQKEGRWYYNGDFYDFPNDFAKLIPKDDLLGLLKLGNEATKLKDTSELDDMDVKSWLNKFTTNPLAHRYISMLCGLYFVIPYYQASAGEFIRCLTSLNKQQRVGYPEGGCISIPLAYLNGMKKHGGKVLIKHEVTKILVENEKVRGVELDNGDQITSKIIISNGGIINTVFDLVGARHFENSFLERMKELKYSLSALTLKIALKKQINPYKVVISIGSGNTEDYYNTIMDGKVPDEIDYFIPIPSNYHQSMAPEGKQLLTAGTFVMRNNFEQNKDKWIENSFNSLEKVFPRLSKNILWYDVTTPEDIHASYGKEASVVGIGQIVNQVGKTRPSVSLPIEGLYMVGGDAGGWGIGTELAAESAFECFNAILQELTIQK